MTKVPGKRYAYKFEFPGLMAACQQQGQSSDPSTSAYAYNLYRIPQQPGSTASHSYIQPPPTTTSTITQPTLAEPLAPVTSGHFQY